MNREKDRKKEFIMRKGLIILLLTLLHGLVFYKSAFPASRTTVQNIREGLHPHFTRLVFDSEGDRPSKVGPATSEGIMIQYETLSLKMDPKRLGQDRDSAVAEVRLVKEGASRIFIKFRHPNTKVKAFFLDAEPAKKGGYRLVLDFDTPSNSVKKRPVIPSGQSVPKKQPESSKRNVKTSKANGEKSMASLDSASERSADNRVSSVVAAAGVTERDEAQSSTPGDSEPEKSSANRSLSGEAAVILRDTNEEGDVAKFEEYRDLSEPVIGALNLKYDKNNERFFELDGVNIGAEDLYLYAGGGWYGKMRIDASYNKIPHRFSTRAETLYSGIGTADLTLPDAVQASLQAAPFPEVATRLDAFLKAGAVTGDPSLIREFGALSFDLAAYDPLSVRAEFKRENRSGVRPLAGSFGLLNNEGMEELLKPQDYETTEMKLIGEYAKKSFLLNATYQYSKFESVYDTLSWDNPLRLTDVVGGPSQGLMDIAPANEYHNFSFKGSLMKLPLKTNITAIASWGLMSQDDALEPFTVNTAIASPPLPVPNVDAKVNTSLYQATLASRPAHFIHINGKFRLYEYNNETEQILFPDGYVVTDSYLSPSPVQNLPTSYQKMTAGGNLGFDLSRKTRLNLGYAYEETDREYREVSKQHDNIFSGSFDASPSSWLDLRLSYERRNREIDGYDYTVPLEGGGADTQEPLLRKYDEADKVSHALQFQASLYPASSVTITGSFNYREDDFEDSNYGLLGDKGYSASLDLDYAIHERANLHAFYSREEYEYLQMDRGLVGVTTADWLSGGTDVIDTCGGAVNASLLSNKLDFDLSYSYSNVEGSINFYTPAEQTSDFPIVDDAELQVFNANLKYRVWKGLSVTVGYLWEKFDFDDFENEGYMNVPTDAADLYQGALLMGTLTESYEGSVVYLKLSYRF
jgi:MtrB/PioB family decaheme-associated outer membrane protein